MSLMGETRERGKSLCTLRTVVVVVFVFVGIGALVYTQSGMQSTGQARVILQPDDVITSEQREANGPVKNWMQSTLQNAILPIRPKEVVEPIAVEEPKRKREFEIVEPKVIADISKSTADVPPGKSAKEAGYPEDMQHFVKGTNRGLFLNDKPFFINGFNNYYMVTRAAWEGKGRSMVDSVFKDAKSIGVNTLRIWGYADGDEWNALLPESGIIDEQKFRDGFDYVVSEAHKHDIRLIITLTNYHDAFGGMKQYVLWDNKTSISDFYTLPAIKSSFKDYIYTVINRKNTVDGVLYKNNPSILGWELANEPRDPGNPSSAALQAWIQEMSAYIKTLDPNHLTMIGSEGYFGPSTKNPARLEVNPFAQVNSVITGRAQTYDAVCEGADFELNNTPDTIDVAVIHLYSDHWTACDPSCKLEFASNWIRHHLEAAAELGRPLLIGEFGAQKPVELRNTYFEYVHKELLEGIKQGYPVAGSIAWFLASEDYPDYDGFTLYKNKKQIAQSRPPAGDEDYERRAENAKIYNDKALLACIDTNAESKGWVKGWTGTLNEFKKHTKDLQEIANKAADDHL